MNGTQGVRQAQAERQRAAPSRLNRFHQETDKGPDARGHRGSGDEYRVGRTLLTPQAAVERPVRPAGCCGF